MKTCPQCGAVVPVDPGWVAWCDQCEWNVDPAIEPERLLPLQRFLRNLSLRHRSSLFVELKQRRSLRRVWTVNIAAAYAVALVVHLTTLGLVVLGGWSVAAAWPSFGGLLGAGVCWLFVWALCPRWHRVPVDALPETKFPALYRAVRRVAGAVMTRPVNYVLVDEEWNSSYREIGLRRRPCITLGLPLLAVLTSEEFVALVAHEAAHGANRDVRRQGVIESARQTMEKWWNWMEPEEIWPERARLTHVLGLAVSFVFAQIPRAVASTLLALSFRDLQRAEYLADDLAAGVSGSAAMIRLMEKSRLRSVFRLTVQRLALREPRGSVLIGPLLEELKRVPVREHARLARVDRHREIIPDYSHPPNHLRIAMLEAHFMPAGGELLSPDEYAAVRAELGKLEGQIRRRLVDRYLSSIS